MTAILTSELSPQLVINELSWTRLKLIQTNLDRLGIRRVPQLLSDGTQLPFADQSFHRVLLDVPCSSSGTLKKNPDIKWAEHQEALLRQVPIQRQLLSEGARVLQKGGILIYVTCSLESEENEEQMSWFLDQHLEFQCLPFNQLPLVPESVLARLTPEGYYQCLPQEGMMGLFAALLHRN